MKFSPFILSLTVAGVAADRLGASPRTSRAAADRTMTHRHLKEEEVGNDGVGQCGQCKKADDCLPNYECVSASDSGCFNFDVSGMAETYCVPGPTDAPTVAVTEAPTLTPAPTAATSTTSAPTAGVTSTSGPTDVVDAETEPTDAPTVAGTTSAPTLIIPASTESPSEAATTIEPTSAPSEAATTVEPTSAPSEAASTTAPTMAATTTTAPTVAATSTTGPTVAGTGATPSPTPEPTVGTIRYIGGDPDIVMRVCEGDCDDGKFESLMYDLRPVARSSFFTGRLILYEFLLSPCFSRNDVSTLHFLSSSPSDDECEGDLVCMQRSGDEPIPGCGGSPREAADYCVLPAGRSSTVIAAAQEAPSSGAAGTRGFAIASSVAVVGAAILAMY